MPFWSAKISSMFDTSLTCVAIHNILTVCAFITVKVTNADKSGEPQMDPLVDHNAPLESTVVFSRRLCIHVHNSPEAEELNLGKNFSGNQKCFSKIFYLAAN